MNYFGMSDVGKVRDHNEDSFDIVSLADNAVLAIVCDGMGGLACGEIASRLALDTFIDTVKRICALKISENKLFLSDREAYLVLSNAATRANHAVLDDRRKHPDRGEMGTTLVAAIICRSANSATVSWINIGDSRIYTVDHRDILQVSRDHSYIQYMIDTGEITPEEAAHCKKNGLITRAVGIENEVYPDIDTFPLSAEECAMTHILLCSDGFSGAISEEHCMTVVNNPTSSPRDKVEHLVATARDADGSDNITLILIDLKGDGNGEL